MGLTANDREGFAHTIARFAEACVPPSRAPEVRRAIIERLIDTVGCARGAVIEEAVRQARAMAVRYSVAAPNAVGASAIGTSQRVTVEAAAFVNGIAARYLDFNDIYLSKEAVHPSDNIPAALALAEALGSSGEELCTALAIGYETHCRLADSVSTRKGRWDNVVLGAIAASVMAGSLLKLDTARQAHAINMAAIGNVALMETRVGSLSVWKAAAAAYAARAGLFAALAASEGITAPTLSLDGTHGLFAQVTGVPDTGHFDTPLQTLHLLDTHLKAYPSQYFTQTAISAALELRLKLEIGEIRRITVSTFEFGRVAAADGPDKWQPKTRETADHSMPYCIAIALLDGELTAAQFEPECLQRADVRDLLKRITVDEAPELTAMYPARVPTRIVVEMEDGSELQALTEYPLGHSRNPMTPEQLAAKFGALCGLGKETDALFADLHCIAELDGPSTTALLRRVATV
ncbi:MmgE/PrpD family protein [Caballeronia sp. 15715]|uniref:MmgE/PrpD family protein n=1 Tax=unclassified Caballeronia TaxID=2646786 RepID=UPI0039E6C797